VARKRAEKARPASADLAQPALASILQATPAPGWELGSLLAWGRNDPITISPPRRGRTRWTGGLACVPLIPARCASQKRSRCGRPWLPSHHPIDPPVGATRDVRILSRLPAAGTGAHRHSPAVPPPREQRLVRPQALCRRALHLRSHLPSAICPRRRRRRCCSASTPPLATTPTMLPCY
jgi:hypothetical protein